MTDLQRLIAVARGDASADVLLTNAEVVNTLTGEIEVGNVAICGDRIAGVGDYSDGAQVIDLHGKHVAPSLIDGHVHPESSMLHIARYAEAVVPRGVGALVTDFHEIANVRGLEGVHYMLDCARPLPLDIHYMVASCVPATKLETSGAHVTPEDVQAALRWPETVGLGEVMSFHDVLAADGEVLAKIQAAAGWVVDGHAPELRGKSLNAYIAAGIHSDHESTSLGEAEEKLKRGMYLMIREGSSEKNLEALLPLVTEKTRRRCMLVVDDRSCDDLMRDGDIDAVVRKAIGLGLDPVAAIQLATINPAEYLGLRDRGAVAPGHLANLVVLNELRTFDVAMVIHRGKVVARDGKPLFSTSIPHDDRMMRTVNIKPFGIEGLELVALDGPSLVIGVVPDQTITRKVGLRARTQNGHVVADTQRDVLKLAVVERHRATGNIGLGLVKGFGLKKGALASSVAHDSHNIVVVGTNDDDIYQAVKTIEKLQGGLVAVADGGVVASLPLPVAGLLSDEPLAAVVARMENLEKAAAELGCALPRPFATLSLLALPVIPEVRLSDFGLIDVAKLRVIHEDPDVGPGRTTRSP